MGYIGFRLGLSSELIKLVGVIVGFFVSFGCYQGLGDFVARETFLSTEWAGTLVMMGLVAGVYLGVTVFLRTLERWVKIGFQERLNQVGGLLAGICRGGLVASILLVALRQLPSERLFSSIEEKSLTGATVSRVAPKVYDTVRFWFGGLLGALAPHPR